MKYRVVVDTNVLVSALRSRDGASFLLISLLGESDKFDIYISVAMVLEYEDAAKRLIEKTQITEDVVDAVIDYICQIGNEQQVFFLWRPFLKDPKDDMVLELAVAAGCNFIITYNKQDFKNIEEFGIQAISPVEFLRMIGVLS
ncbi:MAG: putative toxin-antitoxin system toxin component, PIN family [Anaerolineae bacterium]|nr:putative toxin-antitoxin system toxin component, PIN family [Anaerolineae bacterium]